MPSLARIGGASLAAVLVAAVSVSAEDAALDVASPPTAGPALTLRTAGLDSSVLAADDVFLASAMIEYKQTRPASELQIAVSYGHTGIDYVPDPTPNSRIFSATQPNEVTDDLVGIQSRNHFNLGEQVSWIVAGGAYDGYTDYRSLWLNEYYRQLGERWARYKVGYQPADPWGFNASTGLRWEYAPGKGFLQAEFRYQYDIVAPGYDVNIHYLPFKLIRRRDQLNTFAGRLSLENTIGSRVRTLQELLFASTTDREMRYSLQSSLNWAPADRWTLRLVAGGTQENPDFLAGWVSATLERDWNQTWFVSVFGRCYTDTGQFENALPSFLTGDTAAPPVDTLQTGLGLRWQGRKSSVKVLAGPYFSRYPDPKPGVASFANLYKSRDWYFVQFAFEHQF